MIASPLQVCNGFGKMTKKSNSIRAIDLKDNAWFDANLYLVVLSVL